MTQEKISIKANGARTSDWLGQVEGGILYAYDLSSFTSETWLFRNPEAIDAVRRGLKDAAEGRVKKVDLKKL